MPAIKNGLIDKAGCTVRGASVMDYFHCTVGKHRVRAGIKKKIDNFIVNDGLDSGKAFSAFSLIGGKTQLNAVFGADIGQVAFRTP